MVYIYILALEQGKYYIGKTMNPTFRVEDHFQGNGSVWTKKYKPIKVVELIPDCDDYDEDKYTKKYMDKYGIENVRGGSYSTIQLSEPTKNHLIHTSYGTNNLCFKCGNPGHFANECYSEDEYESDVDSSYSYDWFWCCDWCNKEFEDELSCKNHEKHCKSINFVSEKKRNVCYRCGRTGHYSSSCYANTHINGYNI